MSQCDTLRPFRAAGAVLGVVIAVAVAVSLAPAPTEPGAAIRLDPPGERRARFVVAGLEPGALSVLAEARLGPEQWAGLFAVSTVPATGADTQSQPPMLGTYGVSSGLLHFQPRFPLEPGVVYRARFDPSRLPPPAQGHAPREALQAEFTLAKPPAGRTTRVTAVYPTRAVVPENLLKLYLHFSAPMSRGMAYEHVQLLDAKGKPVVFPFVDVAEELWDPRGERLTLLFDPGRIKTGLKPREVFGPILRPGETYTFVVDRGWLDAEGEPLAAEYRKTFHAGPTDGQPPDPANWSIQVPADGSRQPLTLAFPEPLDSAMLKRVISISDGDGRAVPGEVAIDADETVWRFTPERPWRAGVYSVCIDKDLEDLAGNSIGRPFEVDVFNKVERKTVAEMVTLPFRIDPAAR